MTTHWQITPDRSLDIPVQMKPVDRMLPGASPRMTHLKRLIEVVAPNDGAVLIQGETGTGKELVANAIHRLSGRKGEMVAINCAAIPADLLEGELFGYEKGAFTGADKARAGLIEQARGGTLFLDEIGDMPLAMQAKLLRVLESRSLRRVGGAQSIAVDFRLVAATHRGLQDMVAAGTFRQDLYFRLAVFPLDVPSLSERPGDLPLILDRLLDDTLGPHRTAVRPRFNASAIRALAARRWTGNVRELRAMVQRAAVLFAGAEVGAEQIEHNLLTFSPPGFETAAPAVPAPTGGQDGEPADFDVVMRQRGGLDLRIHVRDIEMAAIESALRHSEGCVSRAATALHLRRTTLIEKMKKYGIAA